MIRFTLACEAGHVFESWFPSGDAYDEQAARGLVSCPICDSHTVAKALMAPAITRTDRGGSGRRPAPVEDERRTEPPLPAPADPVLPMSAEPERRLRAMLRAVHEHVTRNAEHVGARFPDEARAIHYGDAPARPIYGEASLGETRALIDEGIEVAPLPPAPDDRH